MTTRAIRRHHLQRRKAEVRARLRRWFGGDPSPVAVGKHAGVRRQCSCWACSCDSRPRSRGRGPDASWRREEHG